MNAYVHDGQILTVPAPYEVHGGDGLRMGALFGISRTWAPKGEPVEVFTWGVFDVKKPVNEEWSVGDKIYWDETTRSYTATADGHVWIGYAISHAPAGREGVGRVKLVGAAT